LVIGAAVIANCQLLITNYQLLAGELFMNDQSRFVANRVRQMGISVFAEMTALAQRHQAVNLGQGFPDFAAPSFLKEAAVTAVRGDVNQYAPGNGQANLRQAIADKMAQFYGVSVDPQENVMVTHGATEAIFAAIFGLVNPGDEVILFEPFYDSYAPSVAFAGGQLRYYTLRPPDWQIDPAQLTALFSERTKLILVNTPHNPTGKRFNRAELGLIADLCQQHDVVALVDEVYEHILFDGREHISLASLPGMAERTVAISSLGKSFSVTGWKVGWAVAPAPLTQAIFRARQFVTFSGAAPLQEAAVTALRIGPDYYRELQRDYQAKRDFLVNVLSEVGLNPIPPEGAYFIMADISHLGFADDVAFCRYLTSEIGVAAIPPSAFYHNPADGAGLARFAFCKKQETLEAAAERLKAVRSEK
jgi:N-succinyldiaminopimelate aminotransferase